MTTLQEQIMQVVDAESGGIKELALFMKLHSSSEHEFDVAIAELVKSEKLAVLEYT